MPRSIRIQYEGAYYHVMARGNRKAAIFIDDDDRRYFLRTLGEACKMTGWKVHAWVLMGNHYHLFIQTPEANLVEGMKWFQNTYTRRFNVRHKAWGRLFGDRYKAILVEGSNSYYYETLLDYIHLNPIRAGLVKLEKQQSILDYPWSSLAAAYALLPSKREEWMACADGLKIFDLSDTIAGRRKMVSRLDRRAIELEAERCGIPLRAVELDKRCSHLSRGWYWGTQAFSKKVFSMMEDVFNKKRSRVYHSSAAHKAHNLQQAGSWLKEALTKANLTQKDLLKLNGSDPRKVFIALFLRGKTTIGNDWIAEHLKMKSSANVSYRLKNSDTKKLKKELSRELLDYVKAQGFEI